MDKQRKTSNLINIIDYDEDGNILLGENGISTGFVKFDTTPTDIPELQGTMFWDEDDNTVDVILNGYRMKIGEDTFYPAKNQSGSTILKGTNVKFAGTVGASARLLILPFLANGTDPSYVYMGVTAEDIADGEDGKVLWFGRLRGLNTNAFNEGDILYASTTSAGGFQTAIPTGANNIVQVSAVIKKSTNQGVIFIRPQIEPVLFKPENIANKATNLTSPDDVKYPTTLAVSTALSLKQDTLASGTNIRTINGNTLLGSTDLVVGDMILASAQTNSGLKTFLNGSFGLRNIGNTITSFFNTAATVARTWTFPDKSGTVAMTSDIVAQLNGTVNYLVKFGTSTTGVLSRLFDNGTFLGIGHNNPTADLDFFQNSDKTITIHQSDFQTKGRSLSVKAGRTVNFIENSNFNSLGVGFTGTNLETAPNGDIYATTESSTVYVKPNGSSVWSVVPAPGVIYNQMTHDPNTGTIYIANGPNIYKRVNGIGDFIFHSNSIVAGGLACDIDGTLWRGHLTGAGTTGLCYKQINATGSWIDTGNAPGKYNIMMADPNGDVYSIEQSTGLLYKKLYGSDLFVSTGFSSLGAFTYDGAIHSDGTMYITQNGVGGVIQRRLGRAGGFSNYATSSGINLKGITVDLLGNIFIGGNTDVQLQINFASGFDDLDGGSLQLIAGTGKGTGQSRVEIYTGQKTVSGTDMQIETLREYIDENGHHVYVSMPVYADNAAALSGGLVVGTQYRTSTGDLKIVY